MTASAQEQQQYIELLRGIYQQILPLEIELGLKVSDRDQRPRIDYFYDALRAFTDADMPVQKKLERLSLEWLAYDATAIRYLENKPLAALNPHHSHQSPDIRVAKKDAGALSTKRSANREDKNFLSSCYLRFGVMFVALFKPFADRDHRDRVEELDEQVQELSAVKHGLDKLGQDSKRVSDLLTAVDHCHDQDIKILIHALLAKQQYKNSDNLKKSMDAVDARMKAADKEIARLQTAHLDFATSQLALYEQGKDIVKQLANQGLNVAGQHVDNALTQNTDKSRGR